MKIFKSIVISFFAMLMFAVFAEAVTLENEGVQEIPPKFGENLPVKYPNEYIGENTFFNLLTRLRNIKRWGLYFNLEEDDDQRHSFEVGVIAHALSIIKNKYYGGNLNAERAAVLGMYHDTAEIITNDVPSPIKRLAAQTQEFPLYDNFDKKVVDEMLTLLPKDFRKDYKKLMSFSQEDRELWQIVYYADRIDTLIKCLRESNLGNKDFVEVTKVVTKNILKIELPEVRYFIKTFMPAFGMKIPKDYNYPPIQQNKTESSIKLEPIIN